MNEKYHVAAYLRLSQEDEDKNVSDSIVSQKNIIEEEVKRLGKDFKIIEYYIDDGYTGLNTDRPAFQKMLLDIESQKINTVITKDLSRLSRNSFEANYLIEIYFLERNIRYISVLDNVDTGVSNSNNDMIGFKTLINDWYSKDISRKIKSSLWARKEKGLFLGAIAPYGYEKSKESKHKLIINDIQAQVVREIFEQYDKGKTLKMIVYKLQKDKIPSPNNNSNNGEIRYQWREETIKRMLCNKVYLGHIEYGKRINLSYKSKKVKYIPKEEWKIALNTHEPIIDKSLFDSVQNKMAVNKTIKKKKHNWELNGIVKCKECGAKMTLKVEYQRNSPGKLKSKKICCLNGLKRYKGKNCIKGSRGLDEKALNEMVLENLKHVIEVTIDSQRLKGQLIDQYNKNILKNNSKELWLRELKKIENYIKTLYQDLKQDLLDEEDYKKFYQEGIEKRSEIKRKIQMLEEKQHKNMLKERNIDHILQEILEMKGLKKDIVSEIIEDIQIDRDNKIYINYKYNVLGKM